MRTQNDTDMTAENDINKRITELRKALKLSQTEFGANLGVTRGVINNIDLNIVRADSKPLLLQQICKTYDVNREWLESGEGEMFRSRASEDELAAILTELANMPNQTFAKQMIAALAQLTPEQWREVERFCWKVVRAQQENGGSDPSGDSENDG